MAEPDASTGAPDPEAAKKAARAAAAAERKRKQAEEAARIAALPPKPSVYEKLEPWSLGGRSGNRNKKPLTVAVTDENCTGCSGSPVCITYCPVDECMYWIEDEDHPPFGRIEVDYQTCIGCKQCLTKGPDGTLLDGCPWDAIKMEPIKEVEAKVGVVYEF